MMKSQMCIALIIFFVGGLHSQVVENAQFSDSEKLYGLSHFWSEAKHRFVYFDQVPELDWDQAYQDFIPQVLATRNTYEYYRVLQRFCALLKDGHTHVFFPEDVLEQELFFPSITLREINHRAYIAGIDDPSLDDIKKGSEIVEIDNVLLPEYLTKNVFPYICNSTEHSRWSWAIQGNNFARIGMLTGTRGSKVRLTIKDLDGNMHAVILVRDRPIADPTDQYTIAKILGNHVKRLVQFRWLEGDGIAYLGVNSFMNGIGIPEEITKFLPELKRAKGIVVDIRGNHGGSSGVAKKVASHFSSKPLVGPISRTRSLGGIEDRYKEKFLGKVWHRADPYTVSPSSNVQLTMPIVVLLGPGTASGAEEFLLLLDPLEHITFVGQPSYGSTGQPRNLKMPGGGRAQICVKRISYPNGREFVGYGIQPDVIVEMSVDAMREERDPVLEAGIQILADQVKIAQ